MTDDLTISKKNLVINETQILGYLKKKLGKDGDDLSFIEELIRKNGMDLNELLATSSAIENQKIRNAFRRAVMAQMYCVDEDDTNNQRHFHRPYMVDLSDECAFIRIEEGTFVLGKDGNCVHFLSGIKVLSNSRTNLGWIIRGFNDGSYGVISCNGNIILPCAFDSVELKLLGLPQNIFLDGYKFDMLYGPSDVSALDLDDISLFDDDVNEYYRTDDGLVFYFSHIEELTEQDCLVFPRNPKNFPQGNTSKVDKKDVVSHIKQIMSPLKVNL